MPGTPTFENQIRPNNPPQTDARTPSHIAEEKRPRNSFARPEHRRMLGINRIKANQLSARIAHVCQISFTCFAASAVVSFANEQKVPKECTGKKNELKYAPTVSVLKTAMSVF